MFLYHVGFFDLNYLLSDIIIIINIFKYDLHNLTLESDGLSSKGMMAAVCFP